MSVVDRCSEKGDARVSLTIQRSLYALVIATLACTVLAAGLSENVAAQSTDVQEPTRHQLNEQIDILIDRVKGLQERVQKQDEQSEQNDQKAIDPEVLKSYVDLQKRQYEIQKQLQDIHFKYVQQIFDRNIRALRGQLQAYTVLLVLVSLVVVAGTAFSGYQLWKGSPGQNETDVEVSTSKLRITSSVIGLVVLVVSVVFLYIYIKEIYRVQMVYETGAQTSMLSK